MRRTPEYPNRPMDFLPLLERVRQYRDELAFIAKNGDLLGVEGLKRVSDLLACVAAYVEEKESC